MIELNYRDVQGRTALHFACAQGNVLKVRSLLIHEAHVNLIDNTEYSPLFYAVMKNQNEVILDLLKANANVNHVDQNQQSPLDYACQSGFLTIVQYLIQFGANLGSTSGFSALHYAICNEEFEIIK